MQLNILTFIYLVASVTFIVGLKMLSHPETARRGNAVAATGMGLAILGTIFLYQDENGSLLHNHLWIFAALLLGGVIGVLSARRVKMTAMPEMVSLFNGMGGACAALISIIEFNHFASTNYTFRIYEAYGADLPESGFLQIPVRAGTMITIFLGLIIGSVSFAGSIIAGQARG
jgi:NAD(P) transhydrogenase subunit beta